MDKLIVMDNVSGLANKSNNFASKFGYSCEYIFHIINPKKTVWKLILLQTKIFDILTDFVEQSTVLKIFSVNCSRKSYLYAKE